VRNSPLATDILRKSYQTCSAHVYKMGHWSTAFLPLSPPTTVWQSEYEYSMQDDDADVEKNRRSIANPNLQTLFLPNHRSVRSAADLHTRSHACRAHNFQPEFPAVGFRYKKFLPINVPTTISSFGVTLEHSVLSASCARAVSAEHCPR
jgi:hypothetical protein